MGYNSSFLYFLFKVNLFNAITAQLHPSIRLRSRFPIWRSKTPNKSIEDLWKNQWDLAEIRNKYILLKTQP